MKVDACYISIVFTPAQVESQTSIFFIMPFGDWQNIGGENQFT